MPLRKPELPWRRRSQGEPRPPLSRRLYVAVRKHATVIGFVGAGLGWALLNGEDAAGKIDGAWEWWQVDQTLSGYWTNDTEGHLDPPPDVKSASGEKTELAMFVKAGKLSGDIHVERFCRFLPWQYIQIEGRKAWWGFGSIRAVAWDYVGGERRAFAELRLVFNRSTGTLDVERLTPTELFPERVRLFKERSDAVQGTVSGRVDPHCPDALSGPQEHRKRMPVDQLRYRGKAQDAPSPAPGVARPLIPASPKPAASAASVPQ